MRRFGHMALSVAVAALGLACEEGNVASPAALVEPGSGPIGAKRHLLVTTWTTGYRHTSIETAEVTLAELAAETGEFDVAYARTADDVQRLLTPSGLASFDGVFFANTSGDLGIPDLGAFLDWIASGHAFLGAHAATDTYHDAPAYIDMIGGEFLEHGAQCQVDAKVEDIGNPSGEPLAPTYTVFDEIYTFKTDPRPGVAVLLSLDHHPPDGSPAAGVPGDFPLAWTKTYGKGRVFYTALGHREDVWQSDLYRRHILGAIRWSLAR
jgi:type 1 glutamine amidotransferase